VKICFFNRSYWPDQSATGQLLTELAEDLVAWHGCEVTVVAGRGLNSALADRAGWAPLTREQHNGVVVVRANGTALRPGRFAARATNYLSYFSAATLASLRVGRPDVVVSLTDPPVIGLTALWAARHAGSRFVFVCEDVFPEVAALLEDFHSRIVDRALDRVNRFLLEKADAVVALGERMRRRLVEEKGARDDRVTIIHNWADIEAIAPGPKDNAFARAHGLADRFVVMHSGNVGLSQNLDVLVGAAERLRSKELLVIAIVGDGASRQRLERAVVDRRLSNVRFLPYQPKERLSEAFASADVFVVSLRAGLEGYIVPSKLYGILAAGRPYLAAVDPTCEAAVLARDHQCGICVAPGDPEALAAALAALYDDPDRTRVMGENARRLARRFDRRAAVQAYHDLFASVLRPADAA
jgi:colanic acid biosynthesis glycosyl transferase WcaI